MLGAISAARAAQGLCQTSLQESQKKKGTFPVQSQGEAPKTTPGCGKQKGKLELFREGLRSLSCVSVQAVAENTWVFVGLIRKGT